MRKLYKNKDGYEDNKPIKIVREYLDEEIVKKKYNGNALAAIIAHVGSFKFDQY